MKLFDVRLVGVLVVSLLLVGCGRPAADITHTVLGGVLPSKLVETSDHKGVYFEVSLGSVESSGGVLREMVAGREQVAIDGEGFHRLALSGDGAMIFSSGDFRKQVSIRVEDGVVKGGVIVAR